MKMKRYQHVLLVLLVGLGAGAIRAPEAGQTKPLDAEGHQWWQHAVFYEIYPRSFADSNNDGVGDLKGITSKMAYLHGLGVDAIWITPCYPSPQVDFGYDVSDYKNIDPMYGTLADFDRMVAEGKKHSLGIIMDFVPNHTSDQHPWFLDSKSSRTSSHRDWYIWRDGKGDGQPPNNWTSLFGGSAWALDPATNQYYYHLFYTAQPDLNWRNPEVEKAILDTTRWWYKRGVAGFRLDAVDALYEAPDLHDNPPESETHGDPFLAYEYTIKRPENYGALRKIRQVADEYDAVLIGETYTRDINDLNEYYGAHNDGLQLPMDFMFTNVNKLSAPEFRRQIAGVDEAKGWPTFLIGNPERFVVSPKLQGKGGSGCAQYDSFAAEGKFQPREQGISLRHPKEPAGNTALKCEGQRSNAGTVWSVHRRGGQVVAVLKLDRDQYDFGRPATLRRDHAETNCSCHRHNFHPHPLHCLSEKTQPSRFRNI